MSWMGKALRFGDHGAIWRAVKPSVQLPGAWWFIGRFLDASGAVVRKWGPAWAGRRRICGREIGAWLLAAFWLAVPIGMGIGLLRQLFG